MERSGSVGLEEIASRIIGSGAVSVRNVDGGEQPFVYSTGNRGPGYIMIKGLVGQRQLLKFLTGQLAQKVAPLYRTTFDFMEGNATGGMIPGWQLTDDVEKVLGLEEGSIPYVYLRGSRKEGGHGELITGDANNPLITKGMRAFVFEELVNYAGTTTNAALEFRAAGYPVTHAGCIFFYDTPDSHAKLKDTGVTLIPLITLPQLLDIAESGKKITPDAVQGYREFLKDPVTWQLARGLVVPADTARRATGMGYEMRELDRDEAIRLGAPEGKLNEKVVYWAKEGQRPSRRNV